MEGFWQWLYDLSWSEAIRNSAWAFPIIECIHIYSMVSLIGLLAAFDLRLMGFAISGRARRRPVPELAKVVKRWIWIPIAINVITGILMFVPNAVSYAVNSAFQLKIVLVVVGLAYHLPVVAKAANWEDTEAAVGMKVVSALFVLIWFGVIVSSRWIAYV